MVDGWVARLASARPIPTAARWLSLATTVTAFFLIVFGSHVRVTESGMGCPDWPLCYGQAGPILEFHALMEQGHRYVAGLVSLLVCTTAAVMFWYRRSRPATLRPALFTLAMLVVQVLLGAVTVFAGNGSPTVALHLVAGLTLLGGSWVTTLCAFVPKVRAPGPRLAIIGWVAVTSVVLLLIAGSVIVDSGSEGLCASIPFCPVGNSTGQTLVHMVHRGMALLAAVAVWSFALHAWRHWSTVPRARAMAVVASALILGNAGIGTASALLMAPPALADLHLAGAAGVMLSVVGLAVIGWLAGADSPMQDGQVDGPSDRTRGGSSSSAPLRVRDMLVGAGTAVILMAVGYGLVGQQPGVGFGTLAAAEPVQVTVAPTGHTTTVDVVIEGMRFIPGALEVPAGDQLVLNVANTGDRAHDLVLELGPRTTRLAPGESQVVDVGVVSESLTGWCSVAGHRSMGMTLSINVIGGSTAEGAHHPPAVGVTPPDTTGASMSGGVDLMAEPGPEFSPREPTLPRPGANRVHRVRLVVTETEQEVAPGVRQTRWTFGGAAPGPVLRGRVGDRFVVTLVNDGTIGHSIDFHAGALAPDRPMRTIEPGQKLKYKFTATKSGIWMYHCSTMPMSMHIANGMFGAVVIDPVDLPAVDREFLLVQSEFYLSEGSDLADADKIAAQRPDLLAFNGYPMQYDHHPLHARAEERIRFWVLDAGPNRPSAFHVVGGQFDTVWQEGAYILRRGSGGSQVLALQPAQGGFVELEVPEPGNYPFVSHIMSDAERGAHGRLMVGGKG